MIRFKDDKKKDFFFNELVTIVTTFLITILLVGFIVMMILNAMTKRQSEDENQRYDTIITIEETIEDNLKKLIGSQEGNHLATMPVKDILSLSYDESYIYVSAIATYNNTDIVITSAYTTKKNTINEELSYLINYYDYQSSSSNIYQLTGSVSTYINTTLARDYPGNYVGTISNDGTYDIFNGVVKNNNIYTSIYNLTVMRGSEVTFAVIDNDVNSDCLYYSFLDYLYNKSI